MLRATRLSSAEDDTVLETLPVPDAVHDPVLEKTLQRLTAPPPAPAPRRPVTRAEPDRAVYGLD